MKSEIDNALMFNLKGQIAKILSAKVTILREEEKGGLEGACNAIDSFALSRRESSDLQCLRDELGLSLASLKSTRKDAIKKRILPAIEKILEGIK